jgi:hypothetical protein
MKTAAQLKAKSRNLSAATGTPPQHIQRSLLFERPIERTAISEHRDNFINRGGILTASSAGIDWHGDYSAVANSAATKRAGGVSNAREHSQQLYVQP